MNEETLASIIAAKAASGPSAPLGSLSYRKPLKTLKGESAKVEKETVLKVKLCPYSRLKNVREAVKNDERDEPQWPKNLIPGTKKETAIKGVYFATTTTGKRVICLPDLGPNGKSVYFLNGRPTDKEKVIPLCLASEFRVPPSKEETAAKGQAPFKMVGLDIITDFS